MPYQVGDIITLEGRTVQGKYISRFGDVRCVVTIISEEDGRILEAKALEPDERLGRMGFIEFNGDYYAVEWSWCYN